jgi:predicted nucleotide-binding protein
MARSSFHPPVHLQTLLLLGALKGNLERPSDFDGVVYISLDQGQWKTDLGRELEAAGFEIDWNKVMRS